MEESRRDVMEALDVMKSRLNDSCGSQTLTMGLAAKAQKMCWPP